MSEVLIHFVGKNEEEFNFLFIPGSQGKEQKNDQTYMTGRKMGTGRMSNLKPNFSKAYYRYIMISIQLIKARITKAPCKFLQLCTKGKQTFSTYNAQPLLMEELNPENSDLNCRRSKLDL